ncbi:MAG: class I SAM-dependent methyltransferase [Candidatus Omnitrophota bacterium]
MYSLVKKFSDKNRQKKLDYFLSYFKPTSGDSVLDIGASENEYQENGNILEKRYPYPEQITVLGVEEYVRFLERYPAVKVIKYDGQGEFPFRDKAFDFCWSNAVLEHVGDKAAQVFFLNEIKRVSRCAFITTPNKFFPFELHTKIFLLHYLPKKYFDKILLLFKMEWAAGAYMHLLSLYQLKVILKKAGIHKYKIRKNRFMGFVVDFVIIF